MFWHTMFTKGRVSKRFDLEEEKEKAKKWVIMKRAGAERENALEMLQSSVLLCWLLVCLMEMGSFYMLLNTQKGNFL